MLNEDSSVQPPTRGRRASFPGHGQSSLSRLLLASPSRDKTCLAFSPPRSLLPFPLTSPPSFPRRLSPRQSFLRRFCQSAARRREERPRVEWSEHKAKNGQLGLVVAHPVSCYRHLARHRLRPPHRFLLRLQEKGPPQVPGRSSRRRRPRLSQVGPSSLPSLSTIRTYMPPVQPIWWTGMISARTPCLLKLSIVF